MLFVYFDVYFFFFSFFFLNVCVCVEFSVVVLFCFVFLRCDDSAFLERTDAVEMIDAVGAGTVWIASRTDVAAEFLQCPIGRRHANGRLEWTGRLLDAPLPGQFKLGRLTLSDWDVHRTAAVRHATTAGRTATQARGGNRQRMPAG